MLNAKGRRNIAAFLILFFMSVLVLTAGVYSASDSGHNADIMWDIYVGGLSYDGESTYTNHSYQIELYEELSSGSVQAT